MATPAVSTAFGDLLDPRFQKIFNDNKAQLDDMIPVIYGSAANNGRDTIRWSSVGAFGDWSQFTGSVGYDTVSQGYDTILTPLEFASGFQVERKLFDDDQYNVMDQRPAGLGRSSQRSRQTHAARIFNNAFSVDTFFYSNSEAVALCSNSHTTTASGVSTATGFDNLATAALSAPAVAAARISMIDFRAARANKIKIVPDEIVIAPSNYEVAYEIVASMGKVDVAENNRNVHEGAYRVIEWQYLSDSNNWWMNDSSMRKENIFWEDRVPIEFAMVEDFDTLVAKWRGYGRWGQAHIDWRWTMGHQVA